LTTFILKPRHEAQRAAPKLVEQDYTWNAVANNCAAILADFVTQSNLQNSSVAVTAR